MRIAMVGTVAAGRPAPELLEVSHYRHIRPIPRTLTRDHFIGLRIIGDSMIDAHIIPGDIVICCTTQTPRNGDLVIAQTPYGVTCKHLNVEGECVTLCSANPRFSDQHWSGEDVRILGVVRRVERDVNG